MEFDISWEDSGRDPRCPPNPKYPDGIDVEAVQYPHWPACRIELPYPARRCGYYLISCKTCGLRTGLTTAGRADDPKSLRVNCNPRGAA